MLDGRVVFCAAENSGRIEQQSISQIQLSPFHFNAETKLFILLLESIQKNVPCESPGSYKTFSVCPIKLFESIRLKEKNPPIGGCKGNGSERVRRHSSVWRRAVICVQDDSLFKKPVQRRVRALNKHGCLSLAAS